MAGRSLTERALRLVVKQRWLDTEMSDSGARYRLSPYSLRALRFVREIAEGESTVSGARLGIIAHAVRRLADMTSPDRMAQARRIDEELADDARFSRRVDAAINALIKPWQILEPDPALDYLFTISPVIVPLVGVDEMHRLEGAFRQAAGRESSPSPDGDAGEGAFDSDEDADGDGEGDLP